jgi:hypothetical protein
VIALTLLGIYTSAVPNERGVHWSVWVVFGEFLLHQAELLLLHRRGWNAEPSH